MKPDTPDQQITCDAVRGLMPSIHGKWAMSIVSTLIERPRRFSEIRREMGDITQKSLTASLRDLERDGLITRTVTPTIPPRVDYELTKLGESLLEPVRALGRWAFDNRDAVADARKQFESDA